MTLFQKLKRIYTSLAFRIILILLVVMLGLGYLFSTGIVLAIQGVSNAQDGIREERVVSEKISNQIFRVENALRIASLVVQGRELSLAQQRSFIDSLKVKSNLNDVYILPSKKISQPEGAG